MADKKTVLTSEGLENLEKELQTLKVHKRKEISAKINEAMKLGDLSENAEYHAAKDEQASVEDRILKIETILRNTEVIDEDVLDQENINIGNRVTIKDVESGEEEEYQIVGSTEADPIKSRISNESPLGAALLSHKCGDIVSFDAPMGTFKYEILKIA